MVGGLRKRDRYSMTAWLYIIAAAATLGGTTAFVQPGLRLPVYKATSSTTSPRLHQEKQEHVIDVVFEEQDVSAEDPFNYAQNEGGELFSMPDQNLQKKDNNKEIGIWMARALLLGVAILWGTNFASVKYLETLCFHPPCSHPPSEAAFARFGLAALVSLPLLFNQRKDVIFAGLECGMWITLGYIAQALALSTISSGKCAFICSLTVVVVPLVNALLFGKPVTKNNVISGAIALTGVGVLEGLVDLNSLLGIQPALADSSELVASTASTAAAANAGFLGSLQSLGIGKGDLLAVLQPIGFGVSFLRIEHYVEKFRDVPNRIITIAAAECVAVGLLSLAWVLYDYHGVLPNFEYMLEPHRLAAIGWTGIMTTLVAIYIEGIALETASATEAALTFASEPVWASLFGAWLLKERLNLNAYVGGGIILVACILSAFGDAEKAPPADVGESS